MKAGELIEQLFEWDPEDEVQVLFNAPGNRGLILGVTGAEAGDGVETQSVIRLEEATWERMHFLTSVEPPQWFTDAMADTVVRLFRYYEDGWENHFMDAILIAMGAPDNDRMQDVADAAMSLIDSTESACVECGSREWSFDNSDWMHQDGCSDPPNEAERKFIEFMSRVTPKAS